MSFNNHKRMERYRIEYKLRYRKFIRTIISTVIDNQNIELIQSNIEYEVEQTCFSLLFAGILYIFNKFIYIYIIFNK